MQVASPVRVLADGDVRRPSERLRTVPRPALVARLGIPADARLRVVTGPAGYGKTTLLAAWAASQPPEAVAWLSLSEAHNDPAVLIADLTAAIHVVRPDRDPTIGQSGPVVEVRLPRLVNALADLAPVSVVLDDLHLLVNDTALGALRWVLLHAPEGFCLLVGSRAEPQLRQSTWASRGQLAEVRASELRFSYDEAEILLNARHSLALDNQDVELLVTRTEGWAAGLSLAAMSLQHAADPSALIRRFDASDRLVVDYLSDEVLRGLDEPTRRFMLDTSVLHRLSAAVCDHVRQSDDSAQVLARLSARNSFLMPVPGAQAEYRYHSLFASVLRVELQRDDPARARELHERAGEWYREQGLVSESIDHALEGGRPDTAADLVAQSWLWFADRGRFDTVLSWVERLRPPGGVYSDPRISLVEAWVHSLRGDEQKGRAAAAVLQDHVDLDDGPLPDGFRSVRSSLLTLQAVCPWGDVGAQLKAAAAAAELEPRPSPMRWLIAWPAGKAHWYSGHVQAADEWWREAVDESSVSGHFAMAVSSLAYRAGVAALLGRDAEELEFAGLAVRLAEEHDLLDLVAEVHVAAGRILQRNGQLEAAVAAYDRAVECQLTGWGQPVELSHCLLTAAVGHQAIGDAAVARKLVLQARQVLAGCPDPGVMRARLDAVSRDIAGSEINPVLSPAEQRVLELLDSDLTERAVADELVVSFNTVHTHVRSIYAKLGVSSRKEGLARARRLGLLD